jgi:hypothetical protein
MRDDKILAVLVLYEQRAEDARCWETFQTWLQRDGNPGLEMCLVYDNSPNPKHDLKMPLDSIIYRSDPKNSGTLGAYTAAAELASIHGCDWVLFADQDSMFPLTLLSSAMPFIPDHDVLIPKTFHRQILVSPCVVSKYGNIKPHPDPNDATGLFVTAISSGTLFRTKLLLDLLPAPPCFWLDYLDHWLFYNAHKASAKVKVTECSVIHDLSVSNKSEMSKWRLDNILSAEYEFLKLFGFSAQIILTARRFFRMVKYFFVFRADLAYLIFRRMIARDHGLD